MARDLVYDFTGGRQERGEDHKWDEEEEKTNKQTGRQQKDRKEKWVTKSLLRLLVVRLHALHKKPDDPDHPEP